MTGWVELAVAFVAGGLVGWLITVCTTIRTYTRELWQLLEEADARRQELLRLQQKLDALDRALIAASPSPTASGPRLNGVETTSAGIGSAGIPVASTGRRSTSTD